MPCTANPAMVTVTVTELHRASASVLGWGSRFRFRYSHQGHCRFRYCLESVSLAVSALAWHPDRHLHQNPEFHSDWGPGLESELNRHRP